VKRPDYRSATARSHVEGVAGDVPKAKKAYQDFSGLWKDADKDIPILVDARKESAVLQ
jgi:hypothetical protein